MKVCLFCGRPGPFDDEHPFDQWVWQYVAEARADYTIVVGRYDFGEDVYSEKSGNANLNVITRAVCKRCNAGWIKRLGDLTRYVVAPMLIGKDQVLYPKYQRLLARWATKVAMARDSAFPPEQRLIPVGACRELYARHGAPPANVLVWLGRYIGHRAIYYKAWQLRPFVSPGMDSSAPPGFSATIAVGEVIFHVVGVREIRDVSIAAKVAADQPVLQIWPASDRPQPWPPWTIHGDDTVDSFGDRQVWGGSGPTPRLHVVTRR